MPAPVEEWWHNETKLSAKNLYPFMTDRDLSFDALADLLEIHAPWAMDHALLGYDEPR